jgi:hypothetical protein
VARSSPLTSRRTVTRTADIGLFGKMSLSPMTVSL